MANQLIPAYVFGYSATWTPQSGYVVTVTPCQHVSTKEQEDAYALKHRQWECGKSGRHPNCMVRGANKSSPQVCVFCGISESEWEQMQNQAAQWALWGKTYP